ncbi:MAG: hypothetical protein AAF431_04135 [Pseudomonadota bacterium]
MFNKVICTALVLAGVLGFASLAQAQNRVVVIPLFGDEASSANIPNIVTVAPENADFDNLLTALGSITDASASNPYVIYLAPGVYNVGIFGLNMKSYVDIIGSGPRQSYILGDRTGPENVNLDALVKGADNSTLSNLTVQNKPSAQFDNGTYQTGLANTNTTGSSNLIDVAIELEDGANQYGIRLADPDATTILRNVKITLTGSMGLPIGIYNGSGESRISHADVSVTSAGTAGGFGVFNLTGTTKISDSNIATIGGVGPKSVVLNGLSSVVYVSDTFVDRDFQIGASAKAFCDFVFNGAVITLSGSCLTPP